MIAPIVTAAAFAALGAAEQVAWSGFDRWSYNSYSELGTKQADYYPNFFKNNVSFHFLLTETSIFVHLCVQSCLVPSQMQSPTRRGYIVHGMETSPLP